MDQPSIARVYDYYLGGAYNFAVDRRFAKQAMALLPSLPMISQINRAFLRRAVRFCAEAGIRQFLDIGSGIPTAGNVHDIAQRTRPGSRVVYVDNEPVAVAHSELILRDNELATVVQADVRTPDLILDAPQTRALLDFDEPVAVLMVALLHFIPEEDKPKEFLARYRDALAPGSYLIMSHASAENQPDEVHRTRELYDHSPNPMTSRTRAGVTELFDGFELVPPGVVHTPLWRPDAPEDVGDHPEESVFYAAVGRKA